MTVLRVERHQEKKLRVLVIDGINNHDWKTATAGIVKILTRTGIFTVEVSTTPPRGAPSADWDSWKPEFSQYDVVVNNFNGGDSEDGVQWPARVEASLDGYVHGGGGLVVYHAANNAFLPWNAYNEMIGLGWRKKTFGRGIKISDQDEVVFIPKGTGLDPGHPPRMDFQIHVRGTHHPITQQMPPVWMHPSEQLTHGQHGPAEDLTVLTYAHSPVSLANEPMDWVRTYGRGRVYTTMLGHTWVGEPSPNLDCVGFQTLFARGVEWAATGRVTISMPTHFPGPDQPALSPLSVWTCGRKIWHTLLVGLLLAIMGTAVMYGEVEAAFLTDARLLIASGDLLRAEAVLSAGLKANPQEKEAHFLKGFVYFRENKPTQSLAEYTLGASTRRPTASELRIVGADYVLLAAYPDADRWFTKATEDEPENAAGWYLLGRTKYNEGRYGDAISCFLRALQLKPRDVRAEDNLGLSYQALNQLVEAKAAYETAISWQQAQPVRRSGPYLNLGQLLLDDNQPDQAVKYLRTAVELSPKNPKAHEQLGKAWQRAGDLSAARLELQKAAELAPKSSAVHFELGHIYRRLGLKEQARQELELCSRLSATHSSEETPNFEGAADNGDPLAIPSPASPISAP